MGSSIYSSSILEVSTNNILNMEKFITEIKVGNRVYYIDYLFYNYDKYTYSHYRNFYKL